MLQPGRNKKKLHSAVPNCPEGHKELNPLTHALSKKVKMGLGETCNVMIQNRKKIRKM